MRGNGTKVWLYFGALVVIVIASFSVGFSSGLGWSGKSSEYSGSIADQVSEDDRSLVVQKLESCMEDEKAGLHYVSYIEACLSDTEDDWDIEEAEEAGEKWYE